MYALTLTSFKTTTLVVAWTVRCETRFFIIANRVSVRVFSERPTNLHLPRKSLYKKRKTGIRQGQIPVFVLYQRIVASDDSPKVRIFPFPPNICDESSGNLCSVYFQNTIGHFRKVVKFIDENPWVKPMLGRIQSDKNRGVRQHVLFRLYDYPNL